LIVSISKDYAKASDGRRCTVVFAGGYQKRDLGSMADNAFAPSSIMDVAHSVSHLASLAEPEVVVSSKLVADCIAEAELVVVVYMIVNGLMAFHAGHSGFDRLDLSVG
jgi:hypothetical protein